MSAGTDRFAGYVVRTLEAVPDARYLGWGLLVAWGTLSTFTDVFSSNGIPALGVYWVSNMAATTLGLLALGRAWRRAGEAGPSTAGMAAAAACIVASTLAMAFAHDVPAWPGAVVQGVAGLASGFGMAVGTLCWGCYYARLDAQEIESCTIFSLVLMIACYGLGLAVNRAVRVALLLLLPCCSCACFVLCRNAGARPCPQAGQQGGDAGAPAGGSLARSGVGVATAGAVVSALWSLTGSGRAGLGGDLFALSLLSGAVVALALVVWCVTFAMRLNLNTLYRWIVPLVTLALALYAVPGGGAAGALGTDAACDAVAASFGLSPREREVLGYLARGRSLPFIRNELCISKSTASRHVEHIYAKAGVHSREELISLVERAGRP